jgi:hypothetical protein
LRDRKLLLRLWRQAQKTMSHRPSGAEDSALVDIAAGLAALGETLRYDDIDSFAPFRAIGEDYQRLACVEMAAAMADVPPREVYRARKRRLLSAASEWAGEKIEEKLDSVLELGEEREGGSAEERVASWGRYRAQWAEDWLATERSRLSGDALDLLPSLLAGWDLQSWLSRRALGFLPSVLADQDSSSRLLSGAKGDAKLWLRMIAALAAADHQQAIPRVVLAARRAIKASCGPASEMLGRSEADAQQELDAIVDAAVAALLARGQVTLVKEIAQQLPQQSAGVQARLAATASSPEEAERILTNCLEQKWSVTMASAVAETAAGLPSRAARLALSIQILRKARMQQRRQVLEALGIVAPLAGSILDPADLCDAIGRIIATETYW